MEDENASFHEGSLAKTGTESAPGKKLFINHLHVCFICSYNSMVKAY